MILTIKPTETITNLVAERGRDIEARVWEGHDEHGTPVVAFIARVAVDETQPIEAQERFVRELRETPKPKANEAWPLRLILP